MASLKDIRIRIDTTKNTQAITKAMKMVSAAKLRRAQHNIVNVRPYAQTMLQMISDIASTQKVEHPLLSAHPEVKRVLLVVLTSDRGLCGAFNSNIHRFTEKYWKEERSKFEKIDFLFVGRRASEYFRRRGVTPIETMLNLAKEVSYDLASKVAAKLSLAFEAGEYDEVRLVYNEFKSAIAQNVVSERLLPLDIEAQSKLSKGNHGFPNDMIFEPSANEIVAALIKKHFTVQVYRCMSESVAAEHGARMTAMENATKNAGEMIRSLTLTYNKLRQEKITTELIEIVSGAEALKG